MSLKELYLIMYKIRRFEETLSSLYSAGKLKGTTHLSIGQESCAAGVCSALTIKDLVTSTHRGHGHYIAKNGNIKKLMAEFFGKDTGLCRGRGGSQHIFDMDIGFLGANGITGGGIPIAVGAAFSIKYKKLKNVSVAFIGDGASNQGTFHESLNLAASLRLPFILVVENNGYAMYTAINKTTSVEKISDRAKSYNIKSFNFDDTDVLKLRENIIKIRETVINESRPCIIEINTYRLCGHSKSDDCSYRNKNEEEFRRKNDPLKLTRIKVIENLVNEIEIDEIEKKINEEISDAVKFAEESGVPVL